jgi:hypothetical protein
MGLVKALLKLVVLALLGAAAVGAVLLFRRSKESSPVSYDQWPDVPQNPAA